MVLKEDKERIRTLLSETIALMCKSGLHFKAEFSVEALVGITLDHGDEFFLSIRETVLSDVAPPTEPTCSPILSDNNDSCSDDNADVKKSGRKSSQVRHVVGRDPARPSDGAEREGSPVTDDWSSAAADENSGVGTRWTGHKRPKSRPSDRASPPKRRHVDEETGGEGEERGAGREAGRGVVKLEASQSEAQDSEDDCVYVKDEPLSDRGEGDTDTAELNWDTSDLSYSFGSAPSSYDPNSTANASMVSSFTGPTVDGVGAPGIVETGPPPPGHGHRIPISYHQARGPLWKSVPDVQFSGMLPVDGSTGGLDMLNSASTSDSSLNQPILTAVSAKAMGHLARGYFGMSQVKTRKTYSLEFKLEVVRYSKTESQLSTSKKYGVDPKQVREWRKQEARLRQALAQNMHNMRGEDWRLLEDSTVGTRQEEDVL